MLTETAKIEAVSLFALPFIAAPPVGAAIFWPGFGLDWTAAVCFAANGEAR